MAINTSVSWAAWTYSKRKNIWRNCIRTVRLHGRFGNAPLRSVCCLLRITLFDRSALCRNYQKPKVPDPFLVMLELALNTEPGRECRILCLGAHCDDIEIGCGGAILKLAAAHQNLHLYCVVFTSTLELNC